MDVGHPEFVGQTTAVKRHFVSHGSHAGKSSDVVLRRVKNLQTTRSPGRKV